MSQREVNWAGVWEVPGIVVRVIDVDTIVADLDLGWNMTLHKEHIRLAGINGPERNTPAGKTAKAWAVALLPVGTLVKVTSLAVDPFEKYGRTLAHVYIPGKGHMSELAVAANHAVPKDYS
jgi:endonuclease YncB( thermonuclease family)